MTSRRVGVAITTAGIALSVLMAVARWAMLTRPWFPAQPSAMDGLLSATAQVSTTGLLALVGAGVLVLLFSRSVPRWWSLAYVALALALLVAVISFEGQVAADFVARMQRNHELLQTGWTPDGSPWVILGPRLILGVVASLATAAPLLLPPRFARRPPDVASQPLGL